MSRQIAREVDAAFVDAGYASSIRIERGILHVRCVATSELACFGGVEGGRVPFLAQLDDSALRALDRVGRQRAVSNGTTLLLEGEAANRVGIIRSGLVKISAVHPDGYEAVLAVRGEGELLGEVAVFDRGTRSASATAMTGCDVQFLQIEDFDRLLRQEPSMAIALARTLAARLRESDAHRVWCAADGVARRLARALLQLGDEHGRLLDGSIVIELPLTQDDLAGLVGASRDAVAKTLKVWRDQGLVQTRRRQIIITDPLAISRQHRL